MTEWFHRNIGNIIVGGLLLLSIIYIIIGIVKRKRSGKCSCGCSGCDGNSHCGH